MKVFLNDLTTISSLSVCSLTQEHGSETVTREERIWHYNDSIVIHVVILWQLACHVLLYVYILCYRMLETDVAVTLLILIIKFSPKCGSNLWRLFILISSSFWPSKSQRVPMNIIIWHCFPSLNRCECIIWMQHCKIRAFVFVVLDNRLFIKAFEVSKQTLLQWCSKWKQ